MKEVKFFGCWYFYIHSILKEKSRGGILDYKDAKNLLFQWRIPKFLRIVILRELEILNLIEINKSEIIIKNATIKIECPNEVYNLMGMIPRENDK